MILMLYCTIDTHVHTYYLDTLVADAIGDAAQQILNNPELGTDGSRVCERVPHI